MTAFTGAAVYNLVVAGVAVVVVIAALAIFAGG